MKRKIIKKDKKQLSIKISKDIHDSVNKERNETWVSLVERLLTGWLEDIQFIKK